MGTGAAGCATLDTRRSLLPLGRDSRKKGHENVVNFFEKVESRSSEPETNVDSDYDNYFSTRKILLLTKIREEEYLLFVHRDQFFTVTLFLREIKRNNGSSKCWSVRPELSQ